MTGLPRGEPVGPAVARGDLHAELQGGGLLLRRPDPGRDSTSLRDTAWFAMTEADWATARPALEQWLYEIPRDAAGRPVRSLAELRSPGSAN
jgi:hypothetical protein